MEEKASSFKNSVTDAYLVSERIAVLSLLKDMKDGCEHAILIHETVNAKSLSLYKIVLSPKEKSNKAIIEFESMPLKFLQDLPEKTLCQSCNTSAKKEATLRDLINYQQKLIINH